MPTNHSVLEKTLERKKRVIGKGATLKAEGDVSQQRFCVETGWLAASKSLQDGGQQIIEFILPGETYDPTGADGQTSFVEITTLCDSRILAIDCTVWTRLLRDDPDLSEAERLRDIAVQARASERMLRLGQSSAETRIAYVLIELCLRLSACGPRGECAFHVPFGQQQLGDFIGLSSVHVCRTLRRLSRQGFITTGDHMDIEIHDLAALADLAGVDLSDLRNEIIPGAA